MQTIYVWNKKYRNLQTTFKGMEKSVDRESERKIPGMSHGSKNWSRSYKEQGIDLIPTIHEGYEVRAMEKKGIKTVIGELNRAIRQFNQMFISLKESIQWMKIAHEEMKAELDRR